MSSRRLLKAAQAIREVVSMAILTELKDPRVRNVTVTYVEVAPDMRSAKIHVSIMGSETQQNLSLRGLQNAAGFLQHQVAEKIDTRYTPRLQFVLDQGVKHSIAVAEILREVLPAPTDEAGAAGTPFAAASTASDDEIDEDTEFEENEDEVPEGDHDEDADEDAAGDEVVADEVDDPPPSQA